jgi:uncharacterized OB-fold protein
MTEVPILISRCGACTLRYVPRAGPCPRCGASDPLPVSIPPFGAVLAATELANPAHGWPTPHRLALVELAETIRVLAIVEAELPAVGALVEVIHEGEGYRARIARTVPDA